MTQDDWVDLGNFGSQQESVLTRSLLDSAGIPVFIPDENMLRTNGLLLNGVTGWRLQVPASLLTEARELLRIH